NRDGSPATGVRTGGLFSLLRVGLDSGPNRLPSVIVVAAYVRNNYMPPPGPRPHGCRASFKGLPQQPAIAAALIYGLPELAAKLHGSGNIRGLRGTQLDGIALDGLKLWRFDLTRAKFRDASLNFAHFRHAHLAQAIFDRACLRGADFRG